MMYCRNKLLFYLNRQPLKHFYIKQPIPTLSRYIQALPNTLYYRHLSSTLKPSDAHNISHPSSNVAYPPTSTTPQLLTREQIQRSFRRWAHWFTIRMIMFFLMIIGIAIYCWDHPNEVINLKNRISKIFSDVGSQTLNQKELQIEATEYSKQMIKDVFNDANMQQETKHFFISILSQQDFLDTISALLQDLFQRDVMIDSVKELVINVFNDPSVIEQCKVLIGHAISAPQNKELLLKTLHEIIDNNELRDHATDLANDTVKGVLDDEEIKALCSIFLQHVLNDDKVQQSSSDSLYRILVGALTPTVFKRKNQQDTELMEHVAYQHIDVIEEDLDSIEEQQREIDEHANHISSVIGNHIS